ncbi:MAG TPA: hypothetical protein VGJ20_31460 [Xanthobacteraceae bacterium]|jgi:hypothetical protein
MRGLVLSAAIATIAAVYYVPTLTTFGQASLACSGNETIYGYGAGMATTEIATINTIRDVVTFRDVSVPGKLSDDGATFSGAGRHGPEIDLSVEINRLTGALKTDETASDNHAAIISWRLTCKPALF